MRSNLNVPEPRATILSFGRYETQLAGKPEKAERTASGIVQPVDGHRLLERSDVIVGQLGNTFGIELKLGEFQPEHLGKLNFYLEALDRDVRKAHERPSIGVLLCASKDSEVVEYALSRSLSPALVAEYQTRLPDKGLLQAKLHEIYQQMLATPPR